MTFAKRVFLFAGLYGILALAPMYFLGESLGAWFPPAITHPEHFYGFIGVALSWQILFLVLARDPARYRPMMLPAILEKLSFSVAIFVLFFQGRVPALMLGPGAFDLAWAGLFAVAYLRSRSDGNSAGTTT